MHAFGCRNLEGLSKQLRIKCVDWLGTGLSGRPAYTAKTREEAEAFFLESLAAWKEKQGLGKIILVRGAALCTQRAALLPPPRAGLACMWHVAERMHF